MNIFNNQINLACLFKQLYNSIKCISCYLVVTFTILFITPVENFVDKIYPRVIFLFYLNTKFLQIIRNSIFL